MKTIVCAALTALVCAAPARAILLTSAHELQLETWFGQGNLTFSNIFTKVAGDGQDTQDFQNASYLKGATFTLLSVEGSVPTGSPGDSNLPTQIIGGYNPQSWGIASSNGWILTPNDADRTAFIYNLTAGVIQRQNLIGEGRQTSGIPGMDSGAFQTAAMPFGPQFGGGSDITVESLLETGSTFNYSYGGFSEFQPITFGGTTDGYSYIDRFQITRLEIYTFESSGSQAVPDGGNTCMYVLLTFLCFAGWRRISRC
jgi:hypothetical protein